MRPRSRWTRAAGARSSCAASSSASSRGSSRWAHITLAVLIFADCTAGRPLAIIDVKKLPQSISDRCRRCLAFAGQRSGWMTGAIFEEWVKKVYIPEIEARRRLHDAPGQRALLLVDGHSSRASADAMQLLHDHNIDVVTPVAHSSHICQPLDLCFLAVFKASLSGMRWRLANIPKPEARATILDMALNALHAACRDDIIRRSWKMSGIAPYSPAQVLEGTLGDGTVPTSSVGLEDRRTSTRGANINERVLTHEDSIAELKEKEVAKKAKQAARESKNNRAASSRGRQSQKKTKAARRAAAKK